MNKKIFLVIWSEKYKSGSGALTNAYADIAVANHVAKLMREENPLRLYSVFPVDLVEVESVSLRSGYATVRPSGINYCRGNDIRVLGLSQRYVNTLYFNAIYVVEHLICLSEKELEELQGLGRVGVKAIKDALARNGIQLRQTGETGD